jgi:hypothetical protein
MGRRRILTGSLSLMNWSLPFDRVVLDWINNGDRKQEGDLVHQTLIPLQQTRPYQEV